MCECKPSSFIELPLESNDFYILYGNLVACFRYQCRECGFTYLVSRYALSRTMITDQRVHAPGSTIIQPFRLTTELRHLMAARDERREEWARRQDERRATLKSALGA